MNIGVVGTGKMGKQITDIINDDIDLNKIELLTDIINDQNLQFETEIDCLVDASHPDNLNKICEYTLEHNIPCVIATTNYSESQLLQLKDLSTKIPVFYATNYSIGVAVLNKLAEIATPLLKDSFDIEIIEKHHNKKIDSPSGTAKTLFNTINSEKQFNPVYSREGVSRRETTDIGILSLRGGTLFGEHSVLYCGQNEVIEIKHTAYSRSIFAEGMIKSAKWLINKPVGLYNINNLLFKEEN
jgi:4-hydroxy-tetrahydrodipicolinate reductase